MGAGPRDRPLIGVTTSELRSPDAANPLEQADPKRHELALGFTYLAAVERAGGLPVALPPLPADAVAPLLAHLSGVLLSGGPDLDPAAYGAAPDPQLGPTVPELDRFELAVARRADAIGLPLLGVCRGCQVINVARGGTLHQHLPDVVGDAVTHRQTTPGDATVHDVSVLPDSRLARVTGSGEVAVNSFHHQAADRIGRGLKAVAHSEDGVVEGLEDPGSLLLLGVQWHAETLTGRREQLALFEALVEAGRRYGSTVDPGAESTEVPTSHEG